MATLAAGIISSDGGRHPTASASGGPVVVDTVAVGSYPDGVAVNPDTNRIYVTNGGDDTVSVIEDLALPEATPTATSTPTVTSTPTRTPTPGRPPGVGGVVKLPPISDIEAPLQAQGSWRAKDFVVIGAAAGFVLLLTADAWLVKRRGDGW